VKRWIHINIIDSQK